MHNIFIVGSYMYNTILTLPLSPLDFKRLLYTTQKKTEYEVTIFCFLVSWLLDGIHPHLQYFIVSCLFRPHDHLFIFWNNTFIDSNLQFTCSMHLKNTWPNWNNHDSIRFTIRNQAISILDSIHNLTTTIEMLKIHCTNESIVLLQ